MSEPNRPHTVSPVPAAARKRKARRWLGPPFWFGCDLVSLLRLMAANRFAIDPRLIHVAAMNVMVAGLNSALGAVQHLVYSRRVARTEIREDPIFVLGHWRSGTTLLHELLTLDTRFTYPNSYACFAPHHFLLFARYAEHWLCRLLPSHRAMDDMPLSWNSPQEDELALCNLGLGTPYRTIAFPNHPPQGHEYLDLESLPPEALRRWQAGLLRFLKLVTLHDSRRLVLKSPPHTCRVRVLLEMFPDARFVHIVRNPYDVFFSTIKLWMRMYGSQGFQKPKFHGLQEYVFETYLYMQRKLDETRPLIRPGRFHQLRFEELIADPVFQLRGTYRQLELHDIESVVPAIEQYWSTRGSHRPADYPMLPEERRQIAERWGKYFERYGYSL